ncbi:MAG TPA: sigma 54-interacting transcriptional regulator [Polyangia bacterium]|jgi:Nif-specific regulatory protein|nr:sigma 54-interacting transcriptional regulator [Polyangia bacterium]
MLTIEVLRGSAKGRILSVETPTIGIGRAPTNQLTLSDYHLSGEHGQIFREDDQYIYRDLRSTNGSRLRRGGKDVILDGLERQEVVLEDGDELHLGDPTEPVILACRLRENTSPGANVWVQAQRTLDEFPRVAEDVARDTATAKKLLEMTRRLARRGRDLGAVFDGVAEAVFDLVPRATHMAVALADDEERRFTTIYGRARTGPFDGTVKVSRAVIARVQEARDAFVTPDASKEFGTSHSVLNVGMASTIAVPLWDGENITGVIQVYNRDSGDKFGYPDLDRMVTLAGQAALAIENARLFQRLRLAEEKARGENRYLKTREEKRRFADMIGDSPPMREVFRQLEKVIDTRATVCIEGETGTGKELIASAIHYQGRRRDKLFVAQNCAAMPETLLESELFGHRRGAFTGADHDKKGLFEIADGGTLFLDEIGEMPLSLQAKLLRVLQEGEIRPLGATTTRAIDVRIICATNRSLEQEVAAGTFRQDLYYRLKVFPLHLPPLRERRDDIPLLVDHFVRKYTQELKKPIAGLASETLDQLVSYRWPGNIRELDNEIQRLIIQADPESFVTPDMLSPQIRKVEGLLGRVAPKKGTLKDMMEEIERWLLTEALREHGGNKTKTAEALGITREGLHKKLAKYGM